jgi:hypothetical protein
MFNAYLSKSVWMILGLLLVAGLVCPPKSKASGEKYTWCTADELAVNAKRVFYSDPFPYEESHQADYDQAFGDYVSSHYGAKSNASCKPAYGETSRSEARSQRDNDASARRNQGKEAVFTSWTY